MMIISFMTPMDTSLYISLIRVALCVSCRIGHGLPCYGLPPSYLVEMGGQFQSPYVPFGAAHI